MSLTEQDLAWMAGAIDLKGRVQYRTNKRRVTPQVCLHVTSKVVPVVRRMCQLTGTAPELHNSKPLTESLRRACAEHCPDAHVHVSPSDMEAFHFPHMLRWTATGSSFLVVLHNLRPYLTVDHGYAGAEKDIWSGLALTGRGAFAVLSSCNRFRTLGWELPSQLEHAVNTQLEVAHT